MPQLCFKWKDKEINVDVDEADTVEAVKRKLEAETYVSAKKQKLLGLKTTNGKLAADTAKVSELLIKPGMKVMLMGTPDAEIEKLAKQAELAPEVQDDFDIGPEEEQALQLVDRPEVQEKLQRRISSVEVKVISEPRPGKKCLVLDIDYTLFDLGSTAERPDELARPYLHEFLTACYAFYDIIIWSATSMKWVEVKMKELRVLGNENYKVVCLLDHAAMVTVQTERYGLFDCKPLQFIWAKFPDQYTPQNTVMLDDLRRNYVLNKQNGLVIRPYRKAHLNREKDRELLHLTHYLTLIGQMDDLSSLNHRHWEDYLRRAGSRR